MKHPAITAPGLNMPDARKRQEEEIALSLPDLLGPNLDVVFCGLNPGLAAARAQHHFLGRGNRFWRVLWLAGYTPRQINPKHDSEILQFRCGLTTAVSRASATADEIGRQEFAAAQDSLAEKIAHWAPRYVAFLGKAAYAAMSGRRSLTWGLQSDLFGGARVWVLPNPSGLNRAFSLDELVSAYRALRIALDD